MQFKPLLLAAALAVTLPVVTQAKTFRFARAVDVSSWDVHAQNSYRGLVRVASDLMGV